MQKYPSLWQTWSIHTTQTENNSLAKDLKLKHTAEKIISLHFFLLPKHKIQIFQLPRKELTSPSHTPTFYQPKKLARTSGFIGGKRKKKIMFISYVFFCLILAWPPFSAAKAVRINRRQHLEEWQTHGSMSNTSQSSSEHEPNCCISISSTFNPNTSIPLINKVNRGRKHFCLGFVYIYFYKGDGGF